MTNKTYKNKKQQSLTVKTIDPTQIKQHTDQLKTVGKCLIIQPLQQSNK